MKIWKILRQAIVFTVAVLSLILAFASASYASELDGSWKLVKIQGAPVNSRTPITAQIDTADGERIVGRSACNQYFASFNSSSSGSIQFAPIASTRMFCPDIELETKYLSALQSSNSYKVSGQSLIISSDRGTLEYIKAS